MSATNVQARVDHGGARQWLVLAVFGAAVAVAAGLGGVAAAGSSQEYRGLEQPFFAPPSWVFGPVWTVLYVMIAVAGWLSWRAAGVDAATGWWVAQLVLNALWTPIFFAVGEYGWALVEILVLLATLVVTIAVVQRRSTPAAWLLAPYLLWVGFATLLNASIWWLNR